MKENTTNKAISKQAENLLASAFLLGYCDFYATSTISKDSSLLINMSVGPKGTPTPARAIPFFRIKSKGTKEYYDEATKNLAQFVFDYMSSTLKLNNKTAQQGEIKEILLHVLEQEQDDNKTDISQQLLNGLINNMQIVEESELAYMMASLQDIAPFLSKDMNANLEGYINYQLKKIGKEAQERVGKAEVKIRKALHKGVVRNGKLSYPKRQDPESGN